MVWRFSQLPKWQSRCSLRFHWLLLHTASWVAHCLYSWGCAWLPRNVHNLAQADSRNSPVSSLSVTYLRFHSPIWGYFSTNFTVSIACQFRFLGLVSTLSISKTYLRNHYTGGKQLRLRFSELLFHLISDFLFLFQANDLLISSSWAGSHCINGSQSLMNFL